MKFFDFVLGSFVYGLCIAIGAYVVLQHHLLDAKWLFIVASFVSCLVIAFRFHGRDLAPARFYVKAVIGVFLAVLTVLVAIKSQELWQWLDLPEYVYVFSALGSYVMPFLLFNGVQHVSLHHRG